MRLILLAIVLFIPCVSASAAGKTTAFNPDISVNFLGLAQHGTAYSGDRTKKTHNGLSLQEAEMQFNADVDPYLRANVLFAVAQEDGKSEFKLDPEEVYVETISLPVVTLKGGKFKMALGKHNGLHTHAFPFIDQPLIVTRLLGDEGLNETGISAAALVPAPWFSEVTLQAFTLSNDTIYNYYNSGDLGALARLKNLWDLSDSLTAELGFSGTKGKNKFGKAASVLASDLTFKWRPTVGGKFRSLVWSTEYLYGQRPGLTQDRVIGVDSSGANVTVADSLERLGGLASWIQFQFAERWWIEGRYEYVGLQHSPAINTATKESVLLGFLPSEFSGLRLQYDWIQDSARPKKDHAIAFQYNISIGAHPAHAY